MVSLLKNWALASVECPLSWACLESLSSRLRTKHSSSHCLQRFGHDLQRERHKHADSRATSQETCRGRRVQGLKPVALAGSLWCRSSQVLQKAARAPQPTGSSPALKAAKTSRAFEHNFKAGLRFKFRADWSFPKVWKLPRKIMLAGNGMTASIPLESLAPNLSPVAASLPCYHHLKI